MLHARYKLSMACLLAAGVMTMAGCAGEQAFRRGENDEALNNWDRAVIHYTEARQQNPRSMRYRMALGRAKRQAANEHFEKGKMYLNSGRPDLAVVELEQTVLLDPENDYAAVDLSAARQAQAKMEAERNQPSRIQKLEVETLKEGIEPRLEPASNRPISLNFPRPRPIKQIYEALGQAAGINIVFDPALKDTPTTVVLSNVSFKDALSTLLRQENQFYKVIDPHTILIAADTPQNRKTYEDLVIKTFYLSNGDVTEVANAIRALLGTVHLSINKEENAITMRDTADKVAIAQRVIEQNDKEKAEVVVDVELMEVDTNKMRDIGLVLPQTINAFYLNPTQAPSGSSGATGTTGGTTSTTSNAVTFQELKHLGINQFGFTVPNFTLNLIRNDTDAQVLAKPELRISEGEKAQLIIGNKVPIPVTSFSTAYGQPGQSYNYTPITSYQYQDVGIKIEMEPRVHHNKEITLKLSVESSSISSYVPNTQQPIISTRTIASTIRLKDGETNFLAGLIQRNKNTSDSGPAILSDLPLIGRLFKDHSVSAQNTELVMTITPHIIRMPDITLQDLTPVFVGTEQNISYEGEPRVQSYGERGPFDQNFTTQPARNRPERQMPLAPTGPGIAPGSAPSNPFNPFQPQRPVVPHQKGTSPDSGQAAHSDGTTGAGDASNTSVVSAPAPDIVKGTAPSDIFGETNAPAAKSSAPAQSFVQFGFDPLVLTLAKGETKTFLVESVGGADVSAQELSFSYDPAVVQVVNVEPLSGEGAPDVTPGRVKLSWAGGLAGPQPRPVARVTVKAIAAGHSDLLFGQMAVTDLSGDPAQADLASGLVVVK